MHIKEKVPYLNFVCICGGTKFKLIHTYNSPPKGETHFHFSTPYKRQLQECLLCGHILSNSQMDLSGLYENQYENTTYKSSEGIHKQFERIIHLPLSQSDNEGRVRSIQAYSQKFFTSNHKKKLLDIGSGLSVFLQRMKKEGWEGSGIEPGELLSSHGRQLGFKIFQTEFKPGLKLGQPFDLISFNKVLEHVEDPTKLLSFSHEYLSKPGLVYIEIPDVAAWKEGPEREEFFIEHFHIFSLKSIKEVAMKSGFYHIDIEQIHEPSGKYTLRAFLKAGTRNV